MRARRCGRAGDEIRAAELCEAVAGDENLERWEAEEAGADGVGDGDRAMGGRCHQRMSGASREKDESGVAGKDACVAEEG